MGQLLVPAMIGAGVGAVGGAVTGANPFKTALLGAGLGAGGAGLLGGAGGAGAATAAGGADLAAGTVAPAILGTPTLNASLLTPGAMAGLGATPSVYGGLGASSLLDKTGAFLTNNIGNPFTNMSTMEKINLGAKGFDALNQPQQPMQAPPVQPITRGNPEMVSSPLMNVAPNVGMQEGNTRGLPNLMTRMPLSDEEKMRLQQLAQGYRG
jgi:type VI secretion system secreted protein VgrG